MEKEKDWRKFRQRVKGLDEMERKKRKKGCLLGGRKDKGGIKEWRGGRRKGKIWFGEKETKEKGEELRNRWEGKKKEKNGLWGGWLGKEKKRK